MKKTKLFGSRLIDKVKIPRTPNVIMLGKNDDINEAIIEEGDLLDANSIKMAISAIPNAPIDFDVQEITDEDIDKIVQLDSGDINDPFVTKKYVDDILKSDGVVIGQNAQVPNYDEGVVCIGYNTKTTGYNSVAIGNASISGEGNLANSVVIGSGSSYGGARSSLGYNIAVGYNVDVSGCGSTLIGVGLRAENNYHTMIGCCPAWPYGYKYTDKFTLGIGETGGEYLPSPQVRKTGMRINKDDQLYIINVGGYKGDGTQQDSSIKSLQQVITGLQSDIDNKAPKNNASLSGNTVLNTVRIDDGIIKTPGQKYLYTNRVADQSESRVFGTRGDLVDIYDFLYPIKNVEYTDITINSEQGVKGYLISQTYTNIISQPVDDSKITGDVNFFIDLNSYTTQFNKKLSEDNNIPKIPVVTKIIFDTGDSVDNVDNVVIKCLNNGVQKDITIKYNQNIRLFSDSHYEIEMHTFDFITYYCDVKEYFPQVT